MRTDIGHQLALPYMTSSLSEMAFLLSAGMLADTLSVSDDDESADN